jgi:hypothetical protein
MSDNNASFRTRGKQNARAAKDFHLRHTKCKAYEAYISKLCVPWILHIFIIYNQQMHNIFNINCIRKLLHVSMPQCIIILESLLMTMHWGTEICRSFQIQLNTKHVVHLLVIRCKYLQSLILLPQLRPTYCSKVWHKLRTCGPGIPKLMRADSHGRSVWKKMYTARQFFVQLCNTTYRVNPVAMHKTLNYSRSSVSKYKTRSHNTQQHGIPPRKCGFVLSCSHNTHYFSKY